MQYSGINRLNPSLVEYDVSRKTGQLGMSHWLCPIHRHIEIHTKHGVCEVEFEGEPCGSVTVPAFYRYYFRGHYRYYTKYEVIHKSLFRPSKTYGYSPLLLEGGDVSPDDAYDKIYLGDYTHFVSSLMADIKKVLDGR